MYAYFYIPFLHVRNTTTAASKANTAARSNGDAKSEPSVADVPEASEDDEEEAEGVNTKWDSRGANEETALNDVSAEAIVLSGR